MNEKEEGKLLAVIRMQGRRMTMVQVMQCSLSSCNTVHRAAEICSRVD